MVATVHVGVGAALLCAQLFIGAEAFHVPGGVSLAWSATARFSSSALGEGEMRGELIVENTAEEQKQMRPPSKITWEQSKVRAVCVPCACAPY
jgi:hypothetical protein